MNTTKAAPKTYAFAVIAGPGMYGSGDTVRVACRTNDRQKAKAKAAKLTREYQDGMKKYGGSSGFYRVIDWGTDDMTISGYSLDRTSDAK